jgi:hypothetical protein
MNTLIKENNICNSPKKSSFIILVLIIVLAGFSQTGQAGKIRSISSASGADGFGGWNLANVEVILDGALSTFDETTGAYRFSADSSFKYQSHVYDDDVGTTLMAYVLAKDWPIGEPAGIKIVNDDLAVKDGNPTSCIMSTSYLDGHFLDTADPEQVLCSGPFQSHKRFKVAMLPSTVADGPGLEKGIDLVFNVEQDGTSRDYQVFQKINNWTDERLQGFTVQVGTGLGANFVPASDPTTGVGVANLSLSVPDAYWSFDQLAYFSTGLFGPVDYKHGRPAGFFDPVTRASFEIVEFPLVRGQTDTLSSGALLESDYTDLPAGALAAANQFGPWLPGNMLPYGLYLDDDNNPRTDPALVGWYGYNPILADFGWMQGAAENFASISDTEIINKGKHLSYTMSVIDDLANINLNYVVTIADISSFPGYDANPALNAATFTIRVTPIRDASVTPEPGYVAKGIPKPAPKFTDRDAVVALDPNPLFSVGDVLVARVGDADLNQDANVAETVDVIISSTTGLSGTLTLIEQGNNRGVFVAALPDEYSNFAAGLDVTVTMTYIDAYDGGLGVDVPKVASTSTTAVADTPVYTTSSDSGLFSFSWITGGLLFIGLLARKKCMTS